VVAATGLGLSLLTGNPMWDGLASVVIGLVLGVLAIVLLLEAKGLLIGESADPRLVAAIRDCAASHAGVVRVNEVLTLHSAPTMVTVIISADFEDAITARDVERIVLDIETQVAELFPVVARVYVRPRDSSVECRWRGRALCLHHRCAGGPLPAERGGSRSSPWNGEVSGAGLTEGLQAITPNRSWASASSTSTSTKSPGRRLSGTLRR
jgi:hypothetical protein